MIDLKQPYILFHGHQDRAEGGVRDAVGSFASIDQALQHLGHPTDDRDWAQVVNFATGERIYLDSRKLRWQASVEDDGLTAKVAQIIADAVG